MRLPFSSFVNNLLISINRAPSQLSPIGDEAKSLPPCIDAYIIAADKICTALPQDTEKTQKLPWYAFIDEAMLVLADELMVITSASQMDEVDFDEMLGEKPSFFDRVKIKSKTKPRESMVLADFAPATPLPSIPVPTPQVRTMLKRIAEDISNPTSNPSKKAKKAVPAQKT
ncbi:hypothetical protein LIER_09813 [Lithospermum erythrorhizon]|uniref:Uncharacterized protein n=1 Tax=Lithospermum erythrorhizon TaxID=34254 RepID=A0AAV3PH02_LITER